MGCAHFLGVRQVQSKLIRYDQHDVAVSYPGPRSLHEWCYDSETVSCQGCVIPTIVHHPKGKQLARLEVASHAISHQPIPAARVDEYIGLNAWDLTAYVVEPMLIPLTPGRRIGSSLFRLEIRSRSKAQGGSLRDGGG